MPNRPREFGKRGLSPEARQWRSTPTSRYSQTAQASSSAAQSYAAPGYGTAAYGEDDSFSPLKVLTLAFGMLFSFSGRIGRMEYWAIGTVRFILVIMVIVAFAGSQGVAVADMEKGQLGRALFTTSQGLATLTMLTLLMVCQWSLEVRRSHDRDASGLLLLILFIPIVGFFYGLYIFVANGFFKGSPGTNRFDTARSQAHIFD